MSHPTVPTAARWINNKPMIWSSADRIVACDADGSVVGIFATVAEAERALAGMPRRRFATIMRRPRYARTAA